MSIEAPLSRADVECAFPDDEIGVAPLGLLPEDLTDPVARRVLTDIGFPEHIEQSLFFEPLDEPLVTVATAHPDSFATAQEPGAGLFLIGVAARGGLLGLDGQSGACYFVEGGATAPVRVRLAATRLDLLLGFLSRLNTAIADGRVDQEAEDGLLDELRTRDPAALSASEDAWRSVIAACHGAAGS